MCQELLKMDNPFFSLIDRENTEKLLEEQQIDRQKGIKAFHFKQNTLTVNKTLSFVVNVLNG